ncbi:MAG: prephenate dehydratase [Arenicella sp.]
MTTKTNNDQATAPVEVLKNETTLQELREKIDDLDQQIQALISHRVAVAGEIANVKLKASSETTFYRPEREAQVLRRVRERNDGPLSDDEMVRLMREIMSVSLAAEMPITVAYLGPAGTYTQGAVAKHFGQAARTMDVKTVADVFRVVEESRAHFGVVPVENSTEGMISATLDCFLNSELKVCGEVSLPIHHQLLSNGDGLSKIKTVVAHPQALAQCRGWLNRYLPDVETKTALSNAEAAIMAKKDNTLAAIAGEMAAKLYDMKIVASGIEDEKNNTTRFLVIGKKTYAASGDDKTSIVISAPNEVGSLYSLIKPFSENQVDMSRIESRPSRRNNWDYVFFIDVIGHAEDAKVRQALEAVQEKALLFKLLGSYPRAAR